MAPKGIATPESGNEDLSNASLEDLFAAEMEGEEAEDQEDAGAPEDTDADDDTPGDEALEEDAEDDGEKDSDEDSDEDSDAEGEEDEGVIEDEPPAKKSEDLDDKLVAVKVDGEESTVTVKEARHGYMRMQDYTRKTQEVANERKQVEAQKVAYGAALEEMGKHLKTLTGEDRKPDPSLRETDPGEYAAQMADYNALMQYRQTVEEERKRLAMESAQKQQEGLRVAAQVEYGKLLEALPTWKDDKTREKEQRVITKFMVNRGYTPEELANLVDHRAILLIRDALLYNQQKSKAASKTTVKKGAGKQQPTPALKPKGNVTSARAGGKASAAKALQNLKKGSTVDDFAAVLALDPNL